MRANARKTGRRRRLALAALALPLLSTGTCLQLTQDALITGFFNAFTAEIVALARERLGLTAPAGGHADAADGGAASGT